MTDKNIKPTSILAVLLFTVMAFLLSAMPVSGKVALGSSGFSSGIELEKVDFKPLTLLEKSLFYRLAVLGNSNVPVDNPVKRTGPKGVDPDHHNANVLVRNTNGNIVNHERIVSGNMTSIEKALGFPKNTLASHTEARAVTQTTLKAGDKMTITGQLPPCNSCKGYMNRAAAETGATIKYQWRVNGQTQVWVAGKK